MSKPNLKVAPPPPPRSPERQRLAALINEITPAIRAAGAAHAALQRANDALEAAQRRHDNAAVATASAREAAARERADAFRLGRDHASSSQIIEARTEEIAAAEEVEITRLALEACRDTVARTEAIVDRLKREVDIAANAVLGTAPVAEMLARAIVAQAQLVRQRAALRHLLRSGFVPAEDEAAVARFLRDIALPGRPAFMDKAGVGHLPSIEDVDWNRHEVVVEWLEARKALVIDADAPLPE